jgi:hypothetical protein
VRDSQSLAFELIRTGVNTVAATSGVDTVVCKAFLEEMYGAMLPGRRAKEITIADAIRTASSRCANRFASFAVQSWATTIDAFVFYGDPTLHLVFKSRGSGEINESVKGNSETNQLATH